MFATIGIILVVLAVLMFLVLLLIDSESWLVYGFTVVVEYWVQIAAVLLLSGLLFLLLNIFK